MLSVIVKDLSVAVSKRKKIGGATAVMKKDTLEKFQNRLRDAQYMLVLARQTYSEALQTECHGIQIETAHKIASDQLREVKELGVSISISIETSTSFVAPTSSQIVVPDDESHGEVNHSSKGITRFNTYKQTKGKLKRPQWYSNTNYTWDLSGFQAASGWTFSFRQYYTADRYSPATKCVDTGDLKGLQVLLQGRNAIPFDRLINNGYTLLDVCKFL